MFDVGPEKLVLLLFLALVLLGPERLPSLARDAGRLVRTLREVATGTRAQLRDELGPELADLDLRSLNPRTVITRAILGDDVSSLPGAGDLRRALFGDEPAADEDPASAAPTHTGGGAGTPPDPDRSSVRPLTHGAVAPFDSDAT